MAIRDNQGYGGLRGELSALGTGFDFQGVLNLISDLENLKSNGNFDELFYVFRNWKRPIDISTESNKKLQSISPLLTQLISNGLTPEKSNVFSGSIDYFSFYNFYLFLEWIYALNLRRCLYDEDIEAIFSSNILEKIILKLGRFNRVETKLQLNDDFFILMREVKWTNKYVERFHDKLHDILVSKCFNEIGDREVSFKRELKRMARLLAVCSTINKERVHITTSDIISAYRVIFKIMRTDITVLVNKSAYKGILTCHGCGGYYHLQEYETPDDFIYCSCGSTLTYVRSMEEVEYHHDLLKEVDESLKELIIDEKGLIAGITTSLVIALVSHNIALLTLWSGMITVFMAKNHVHRFKYGFLAGNISGALFIIAVFMFGIIMSGIELNNIPSIGDINIFIFILVLGVFTIYCGKIGTFLLKQFKNKDMVSI